MRVASIKTIKNATVTIRYRNPNSKNMINRCNRTRICAHTNEVPRSSFCWGLIDTVNAERPSVLAQVTWNHAGNNYTHLRTQNYERSRIKFNY